jgi:uncharacterized protein
MKPIDDEVAIDLTQQWIEKFVLGLNLCPFARHPFKNDKIRYVVSKPQKDEDLIETLVTELFHLQNISPVVCETTLIIFPSYFEDFEEYLDFVDVSEIAISNLDMEGKFQIATFHPDYQFEDTEPDDVENFTNRSPFPMLHLLREEGLERAIEAFPEVGDIPEKNIETMRQLGLAKVIEMYDEFKRKD